MAWCPGPANLYAPFGWTDLPIPPADWAAENRWTRTLWSNLTRVRRPIPPSTPHLLCHRIGIELLGIKRSPPLQVPFVFLVLGIASCSATTIYPASGHDKFSHTVRTRLVISIDVLSVVRKERRMRFLGSTIANVMEGGRPLRNRAGLAALLRHAGGRWIAYWIS
jgi:hypothetical protein